MNTNTLRRRPRNGVNGKMLLDDGTGKREARVAMPVRMVESLADYVRERAGWKKVHGKWQKGAGQLTDVIEDDLHLAHHLHRTLMEHKKRLILAAVEEGLDWSPKAVAELYGRLILRGLEDLERKRK